MTKLVNHKGSANIFGVDFLFPGKLSAYLQKKQSHDMKLQIQYDACFSQCQMVV